MKEWMNVALASGLSERAATEWSWHRSGLLIWGGPFWPAKMARLAGVCAGYMWPAKTPNRRRHATLHW